MKQATIVTEEQARASLDIVRRARKSDPDKPSEGEPTLKEADAAQRVINRYVRQHEARVREQSRKLGMSPEKARRVMMAELNPELNLNENKDRR